jgi:hypothetical protein
LAKQAIDSYFFRVNKESKAFSRQSSGVPYVIDFLTLHGPLGSRQSPRLLSVFVYPVCDGSGCGQMAIVRTSLCQTLPAEDLFVPFGISHEINHPQEIRRGEK